MSEHSSSSSSQTHSFTPWTNPFTFIPTPQPSDNSAANSTNWLFELEDFRNIELPEPRRVDCSLLPLNALTTVPTDYDPTLRESAFDEIHQMDQEESLEKIHKNFSHLDCAFSAQQRVESYFRLDPSSYSPSAIERDISSRTEIELTLQANKEEGEIEKLLYDPEETEIDHAPEGFESFEDYHEKVRPLLNLPADLENIVLDYLDFDATDRLHQVLVTVQRLFEEVSFYRQDCIKCGEDWPPITEEASKEKKDADEIEAVLIRPESKEEEVDEAMDDAIDAHAAQSSIRNHPIFYHLSPYTRKIVLEFAAKAAADGVKLVTDGSKDFIEEPFEAEGMLPSKYLQHVQEALDNELEVWLELHEEIDRQYDMALEEIHFAKNVVEVVQCVFALPSSGIFVNEEQEYEVKDVSEYNDVQEGTAKKKRNGNSDGDEHTAAAANLTSFAESSASSSDSNPRKRSRDETDAPAAAAAAAAAASNPTGPAVSSHDNGLAEGEAGMLQSLTDTSYQQITTDHPELRSSPAETDRTAHIDKKLKLSFAMSVEEDDDESDDDDIASRTRAVLRDPDFHEKEAERRSKLTEEERKAEAEHDPNSDDEEPYYYPLKSSIWRRRMTSEKYEAAWVCLEYFNNLQALLSLYDQGPENDRNLMRRIDEVKEWTEKLRISVSHYYLLHMNRSLADDRYLCSLNQLAQVRMEQAATDLVFNKQSFEYLVAEISREYDFDMKWSAEALEALQTEAENFVENRMQGSSLTSMHQKVNSTFDFDHLSRHQEEKRRQRRRDHNWTSGDEDGEDLNAHKDPAFRLEIQPRDLQLCMRLSKWNE